MRGVIRQEQLSWRGLTLVVQYKLVKNITLRIKRDCTVQLTAPYGITQRELLHFLSDKEDWVREKLALMQQEAANERYAMGEIPFDGEHVWLWGRRLSCRFLLVKNGNYDYKLTPEGVSFTVKRQLTQKQQADLVGAMYAYEVRTEGAKLISQWQQRMGVHCTGLKVHVMKTRWGSCNVRTGGINLNTLLACWPKECLEYIVVHELAHLLEANHSPRFHRIVGSFLPDWRERKRLLESFQPV